MTIMDDLLVMMDSTAIGTSIAAAAIKGDVVYFGGSTYNAFGDAQTPDINNQGGLYFNIICEDEDFATSGSPVVTVTLVTAADASLSSGAVTLMTKALDGTPNDGDILYSAQIPAGTVKAYIGTKVQIATAAMTAGKLTTFLSLHPVTEASSRK